MAETQTLFTRTVDEYRGKAPRYFPDPKDTKRQIESSTPPLGMRMIMGEEQELWDMILKADPYLFLLAAAILTLERLFIVNRPKTGYGFKLFVMQSLVFMVTQWLLVASSSIAMCMSWYLASVVALHAFAILVERYIVSNTRQSSSVWGLVTAFQLLIIGNPSEMCKRSLVAKWIKPGSPKNYGAEFTTLRKRSRTTGTTGRRRTGSDGEV